MKRNKTDCKHRQAFPTIFARAAGFLWCPDCGAMRTIVTVGRNSFTYDSDRWIYPTGKEDVLEQLDREKKREIAQFDA